MATMEMIEGRGESHGQSLPPISAWDKIIVAIAGPLFSFLLAVAFAVVVYALGRPNRKWDEFLTHQRELKEQKQMEAQPPAN